MNNCKISITLVCKAPSSNARITAVHIPERWGFLERFIWFNFVLPRYNKKIDKL